jgi:hypothetical protein
MNVQGLLPGIHVDRMPLSAPLTIYRSPACCRVMFRHVDLIRFDPRTESLTVCTPTNNLTGSAEFFDPLSIRCPPVRL